MSARRPPELDDRRESDFLRQLLERARLWVPAWSVADGQRDVAQALLAIAARYQAEVAERLDKGAEKMALGFLDWLAIRGQAAIPARMPVVFQLAENAAAVTAPAPVQLMADALGTAVMFETESDVRLLPGRLQMVVGADSAQDAYYLPPPGLASLEPLAPLPTEWRLRSFAGPGAATLQLDPPTGLVSDMLLEIGDQQFRVIEVNDDLVTIDPPLPPGAAFGTAGAPVRKVAAFDPFGGRARNRQVHALYLGHPDLLNIEAPATIQVGGLDALGADVDWHYWGMAPGAAAPDWQPFDPGSRAAALIKPAGAIEERQVGELASRWIRASIGKALPGAYPLSSDRITLSVNPVDLSGPCDPGGAGGGIGGVVALANNTPLELNDIVFPLGREPRQFDAFYLGSEEAFSKHGADVRICIDMAEASFTAFASLRMGSDANRVLAGVALDGHLYLFRFDPSTGRLGRYPNRQPLRPPSPAWGGAPAAGLPVALDAPPFRPALWSRSVLFFDRDIFIAVSAHASVWVWRESGILPASSGWIALGVVDAGAAPDAIGGLVYLADGYTGNLFALLGGALYVRNPDDTVASWSKVDVELAAAPVALAQIAPIVAATGDMGSGTMAEGLLAIGVDQAVYVVTIATAGGRMTGHCTPLFNQAVTTVAPAGLRRTDGTLLAVAVCTAAGNKQKLRAFLAGPGALTDTRQVDLDGVVVGPAIDVNLASGTTGFAVTLQQDDGASAIGWWSPFNAPVPDTLMTTTIPEGRGTAAGAPTLLAQHIVVPARSSEVLVAEFNLARQQTFFTHLGTAVVTPLTDTPLAKDDHIAVPVGTALPALRKIAADGINHDGETLYEMDGGFGAPQTATALLVYRAAGSLAATVTASRKISLDAADAATAGGDILLVDDGVTVDLYKVNTVSGARVATLDHNLGAAVNDVIAYWRPEQATGAVRPMMKLDASTGNWDAGLLDRTSLIFPGADPERQRGTAFVVDAAHHPTLVALAAEFAALPAPTGLGTRFVVDGAVDHWTRQLGDAGTNPELSWEYWNGTAWWKVAGLRDETLNLKRSGAVRFTIPADMQPTEWAGKSNHWIRARLVGGDYGQARTVVRSVNKPDGSTEQTIERFPDDVTAPQVLQLRVQYSAGKPVLPVHVVTVDSGALRDQSDANRTDGALVTVFTPLASALPSGAAEAPPRALYLGFSGALAGQPINLLALVDREQLFDAFAPLRIEALCGEQFMPVVAEDTTRALGESGLLSLSLTLPTVATALFGSALCWLRLSPSRQPPAAGWAPALRGLYLNAAWARACETLARERLGSSTGAPDQAFLLARPPLLQDTLELRVREPLSPEEREALVRADPASVVSDVATDLQGHWVRWRQVVDVDDAGPLERVYALDETSGEVRFGDGRHGMIPPTGRDAIVAFSYQRTEPGAFADTVPANRIAPRTALNLMTPIEGVEAAFAADQSAGGAPPETADRIRRFAPARLRHRDRVLTLRDVEAHALQSAPDIVQARAFRDAAGVRLVVVMRGKDVQPGQAVKRELRRVLLAAAPPGMSAGRALRIDGPAVRRLRITVALHIDTLAGSGRLADHARLALGAFFDPAVGGLDRTGWPLGTGPADDDVALALLDAPGLEGIAGIVFEEIDAAGSATPWRRPVRRDELVMLADDGVRIDFVTVEAGP
jgi:hypothetical protein